MLLAATMIASAATDVAALIVALATFMTALATLLNVRHVKHEVTTLNGQTMAVLADKAETRRIDDVAVDERTPSDLAHIDSLHRPEDRDQ